MNVKLHTPKTLKTGSGMSSTKQFLLSLIATTVSIVLTFGTAAIVDHHKKQAAKKEMVMMVISDFDKSIEKVEKADTALRECRRLQQELAASPEHFDSLRFILPPNLSFISDEFSETAEKIFSTSIETFNTIGDVNFVNEVSSFYMVRRKYKEEVLDKLMEDVKGQKIMQSLESLMNVAFPEYVYENWVFLKDMKASRDRCMQMMNLSEEDITKFSKQHENASIDTEDEGLNSKMLKEFDSCNAVIEKAKQKLKH